MDTLLLTRSAVQGLLNPAELLPELIENDEALGRISNHQITIYGSVGLAFQDLAAAWQVYRKAKELNIGENINFLE